MSEEVSLGSISDIHFPECAWRSSLNANYTDLTTSVDVSFVPDPINPLPVVLPMIARAGTFPSGDGEAAVYVHGYVSARMFRQQTGRSEPATRDADEGFPVCIAATKIDNLVLALTPFNHSCEYIGAPREIPLRIIASPNTNHVILQDDYRSAVVHGTATLLDPGTKNDPRNRDEILWAMQIITDGMVAGRWEGSRVPPEESEIAATRILKVRVDTASAKIRDSGVSDDARDLKDTSMRERVWTGTIPYVEMLGEPVAAETNMVATVPTYISEHVRGLNEKAGAGSGGLVSKFISSLLGR